MKYIKYLIVIGIILASFASLFNFCGKDKEIIYDDIDKQYFEYLDKVRFSEMLYKEAVDQLNKGKRLPDPAIFRTDKYLIIKKGIVTAEDILCDYKQKYLLAEYDADQLVMISSILRHSTVEQIKNDLIEVGYTPDY